MLQIFWSWKFQTTFLIVILYATFSYSLHSFPENYLRIYECRCELKKKQLSDFKHFWHFEFGPWKSINHASLANCLVISVKHLICTWNRKGQNKCLFLFNKGPFKYYVIKEVGGWGQKMAILDDLQYCKSSKSWVAGPKKVKNMMT